LHIGHFITEVGLESLHGTDLRRKPSPSAMTL
jgi:hypothetical protein